MSTTTTKPVWDETTVEVACVEGPEVVPAMVHPHCPGLAVTMRPFGVFRVSHVRTGMAISGEFERAGNAAAEMVTWAALALALGFSWDNDGQACAAAIKAGGDTPFPAGGTSTSAEGVRPLTISEWVGMARYSLLADEFPWEDESAWGRAERLVADLRATLTPEDSDAE
jgi:hypothetical protein